jgi:hypothetical protein
MTTTLETLETVFNAAKAYSGLEKKGDMARTALVDLLIANNVRPGFHTRTENAEGKKVYSAIAVATRNGIIAGWGSGAVRMMATPTKELTPQGKFEKDAMNKALGSRMNKISEAIETRLNPPVAKEPGTRKDDNEWFAAWLADGLKRAQSSETLKCDVVELTTWLKASPFTA